MRLIRIVIEVFTLLSNETSGDQTANLNNSSKSRTNHLPFNIAMCMNVCKEHIASYTIYSRCAYKHIF